jgi:hypothetical protein
MLIECEVESRLAEIVACEPALQPFAGKAHDRRMETTRVGDAHALCRPVGMDGYRVIVAVLEKS